MRRSSTFGFLPLIVCVASSLAAGQTYTVEGANRYVAAKNWNGLLRYSKQRDSQSTLASRRFRDFHRIGRVAGGATFFFKRLNAIRELMGAVAALEESTTNQDQLNQEVRRCSARQNLRFPSRLLSAPLARRRLQTNLATHAGLPTHNMGIETTVIVAHRLVAHLAVTLVCHLALLAGQNQMAGDGEIRASVGLPYASAEITSSVGRRICINPSIVRNNEPVHLKNASKKC